MLVILLYNLVSHCLPLFFFFNDTATTEIYTLSLHDALPILARQSLRCNGGEDLADRVVTQPHRPGVLAQRRRPYRLSAVRGEGRGICGGGADQPGGLSRELILGRMELEKMSAYDVLSPVPRLQQKIASVSFRYPQTCRRCPLQLLQRGHLCTELFREHAADGPVAESKQRHHQVRVGCA